MNKISHILKHRYAFQEKLFARSYERVAPSARDQCYNVRPLYAIDILHYLLSEEASHEQD